MIGKTYLLDGEPVVVIARWEGKGPRNVLLERADGSRLVRPFRGLRKPMEIRREGAPNDMVRLGTAATGGITWQSTR